MTNMAGENLNANVVLSASNQQYDQSMQQSATYTDQLSTSLTNLNNKVNSVMRTAGKTLIGVSAADVATITGLTASYARWEDQMSSLQSQAAVLGKTIDGQKRTFNDYKNNVNAVRREFGDTTAGAAQLIQTLSKLNDHTATVKSLADTYEKLGKASGEAPTALAASMTQLQRTMGTSQRDTEKYANQLTVLQARSNSSAQAILEFSNSIAPVGRLVGMTQTDLMGFSNGFIKAGQDGYQAANVFNKIISDISNATKTGSPLLNQYANLVDMTTQNFKSLSGTDQVLRFFDAVNRQGPNAISALNRLGYDGQRTLRTITAMTQSGGGIAAEIAAARNADPNALNKGSAAAAGGIVDNLKKLRAELSETSEAMGENFETPANAMIKTFTAMAAAIRTAASSPLGDLASGLMAVAAPLTAIAGTALVANRAIAAYAGVRALTRSSLTEGFKSGRTGAGLMSVEGAAERGFNFVQRGLFNAGTLGGGLVGPGGGGPGLLSRAVGYGGVGGGYAARLYGQALYSPGSIRIPGVAGTGGGDDPARRMRVFENPSFMGAMRGGFYSAMGTISGSREAQVKSEQEKLKGSRLSGLMGDDERRAAAEQRVAAREAAAGLRAVNSEAMSASKGFSSFARGLGNMTGLMVGAGAGAVRTAGSLAGSAMSSLGISPLMLGLLGAGAAYTGYKSLTNDMQFKQTDYSNFMSPYFQAGGLTGIPGASSPSYTSGPKAQSLPQAYNVTVGEAANTRAAGYKYTNTSIRDAKSINDAVALLQGQWGGIQSNPQAVNAVAMDLTARFGRGAANTALSQLMGGGRTPNLSSLARRAAQPGSSGFMDTIMMRESGKGTSSALSQAFGAISSRESYLAATQGEQARMNYRSAAYQDLIRQFGANQPGSMLGISSKGTLESVGAFRQGIAQQLFGVDLSKKQAFFDFGKTPASLEDLISTYVLGVPSKTKGQSGVGQFTSDQLRQALGAVGGNQNLTGTSAVSELMRLLTNPTAPSSADYNSAPNQIMRLSSGLFGSRGVLNNSTVNYALTGGSEDANAQYQAIYAIANAVGGRGNIGSQIKYLTNLGAATGGDASVGYDLFKGATNVIQQRMQFAAPYQSLEQNYQQQGQLFRGIMTANMGPEGQAQREQATATFAQQTQDMYGYFKDLLYQQREFDVQRSRAETDFNLQRSYAMQDFNISRARAEDDFALQRKRQEADFARNEKRNRADFNLSRKRQEEDYNHQVELMVKQQAKSMMNIYERVRVQRTHSAGFLAVNAQDQLSRMQSQEADLDKLRKMGLSKDAIQQLDLTNPDNQQQLSRFLNDVSQNPQLIKQFNDQVAARLKAAKDLVTDDSSSEWEEFQNQYNKNRTRAQEDFDKALDRSHADFKRMQRQQDRDFRTQLDRSTSDTDRAMGRMKKAFDTQMSRAQEDLQRSSQTIDGNFETILTQAAGKLSGHAKTQAQAVLKEFQDLKGSVSPVAVNLMTTLASIFGVKYTPPKINKGGNPHNPGAPVTHYGPTYSDADGGVLPGFTPGRDVHTFHGAAGTLELSGGEAIMRPEWVRAVGGAKSVEMMNRKAKYGGFKDGGIYWPVPGHETGTYPGHDGVDINRGSGWDDYGDPIRAAASGKVSYVGTGHGYGEAIFIKTDLGPTNIYGHTSAQYVKAGQKVKGGVLIGKVGNTGNSSAPHLHFGVDPGLSYAASMAFLRGAITKGISPNDVAPVVASLSSILKDTYPKVEKVADAMDGLHILQHGDMSGIINSMARQKYRQMKRRYGGTDTTPSGGPGKLPEEPKDHLSNQGYVRKATDQWGWEKYWSPMYSLVMSESGFNNRAQNPTSTAYGMFQFLDSTWKSVGGHKTSDPWLQSVYGMKYIQQRYGNPAKAWDFHKKNNWYGDGGVFNGAQTIGVGERGPEAVIPLNDDGASFMADVFSKTQVGTGSRRTNTNGYSNMISNNYYAYRIDRSTNFTGAITVQAQDPNEMLAKLRQQQRRYALTQASIGGQHV